jgi:hypothetical protein
MVADCRERLEGAPGPDILKQLMEAAGRIEAGLGRIEKVVEKDHTESAQ